MSSRLYHITAAVVYLLCSLQLQEAEAGDIARISDDSCKNYNILVKSLFESESNLVNLSLAFFPLQDNPPEFVTVTYCFGNSTQVWYWSSQISHFLHPFEVFQFMSLFFSKPEHYYTGRLTLTLRPDCAEPGLLPNGNSRLQLLTHRLKLYAERGSTNIILNDGYKAKAFNESTLKNFLKSNDAQHAIIIIVIMTIFVTVLPAIIIILILFVYFCTMPRTQSSWTKKVQKNKPAVLSFTVLSCIMNVYIFVLTCTAADFYYKKDINQKLYSSDEKHVLLSIWFALLVDLLCIIGWGAIVIASCNILRKRGGDASNGNSGCTKKEDTEDNGNSATGNRVGRSASSENGGVVGNRGGDASNENSGDAGVGGNDGSASNRNYCHTSSNENVDANDNIALKNDNTRAWLILSATVLCPIFCVIAHSPYIAIAYLNDGSHASSIFIYYTILCYIFFGVMKLFFNYCCLNYQHTNVYLPRCPRDMKKTAAFLIILCMCISVLLLLVLVVIVTCYFVLIPINKSISDAPNRLVSIYQSGGFLIGSFITYKVIKYFYRKKPEEEEDVWDKIHNGLLKLEKKCKKKGSKKTSTCNDNQPDTAGGDSTSSTQQNPSEGTSTRRNVTTPSTQQNPSEGTSTRRNVTTPSTQQNTSDGTSTRRNVTTPSTQQNPSGGTSTRRNVTTPSTQQNPSEGTSTRRNVTTPSTQQNTSEGTSTRRNVTTPSTQQNTSGGTSTRRNVTTPSTQQNPSEGTSTRRNVTTPSTQQNTSEGTSTRRNVTLTPQPNKTHQGEP